jgi:hypothetical protein
MQAHLEFAPGVDLKSARAAVQKVPGVRRVVQVFPDDRDVELAGMHVVEIDPALASRALSGLRSLPVVESVEVAATKTIRGQSATSSRS